ncbi:MAG: flavodoxin [Methylococcaceae bacterium]|jgi:flavodoxin I
MNKIGIFYGTQTGMTEAIAEVIYRLLGDEIADAPVDVSKAHPSDLLDYSALILGTPSYGIGELPGRTTGSEEGNWEEFLMRLGTPDLSGKRLALFGLGNQEKYFDQFASALIYLYNHFINCGAEIIGSWTTEDYDFSNSHAIIDNRFVGLVIDHHNQPEKTKDRILTWLAQIKPGLTEKLHTPEFKLMKSERHFY